MKFSWCYENITTENDRRDSVYLDLNNTVVCANTVYFVPAVRTSTVISNFQVK